MYPARPANHPILVCRFLAAQIDSGKDGEVCAMAGSVLHVTDQSFEQDVLKADQPVLVDFWAAWCGPCRMIAPTVEALANEYTGRARVVKMNVDENQSTPAQYNIRGIPTLLLFKGGQVRDQLVGAASRDVIEDLLKKYL
jgi:thioredoxin 1